MHENEDIYSNHIGQKLGYIHLYVFLISTSLAPIPITLGREIGLIDNNVPFHRFDL
ncbi:hypothetical protein [Candidatus Williamhamiltonella defendens]|uniref:hypothetical protein n=1 Tax=Candidatus Williamhamiltonella defendens TaxID=138072 RepID=UPI001F219256|nr:hypothetical protein [Candidatus Hamiltonella defensa]